MRQCRRLENTRGPWAAWHDRRALRRNVYRVPLTRGRDGTVVCVPPATELDETWLCLRDVGFATVDDAA